MSREIKFRAWDNRDKKFVATGFSVIGEVTMFGVIDEYCFETKSKDQTTLDRLGDIEIEQFTGLKDRNDKDIYEGDIIRYREHDGYLLPGFIAEVRWIQSVAGFGYLKLGLDELGFEHIVLHPFSEHDEFEIDVLPYIEVVGNIHQNPELL